MAQDWYPVKIADRIPWYSNFNAQAVASGTSHGLIAAQVTQITAEAAYVTAIVNWLEAVVQGMQNNARVGGVSGTVSAVTVP